jgi:hypothetical protein
MKERRKGEGRRKRGREERRKGRREGRREEERLTVWGLKPSYKHKNALALSPKMTII